MPEQQDRRAAAREIAQEIIAEWIGSPDDANDVLAEFDENGIIVTFAQSDTRAAPDAPSGTVCISREAKEILDHILYKHGDTYAFLEPLRDALAAAEGGPGDLRSETGSDAV